TDHRPHHSFPTPRSSDLINAKGSLDELTVDLTGEGQDLNFDLHAQLAPRSGFPLQQGNLALRLADGSSLNGDVKWSTAERDGVRSEEHTSELQSREKLVC